MAIEEKGRKTAAVVTIKDADKMTKRGRRDIAHWLRRHADWLEECGDKYVSRFRGAYYYKD